MTANVNSFELKGKHIHQGRTVHNLNMTNDKPRSKNIKQITAVELTCHKHQTGLQTYEENICFIVRTDIPCNELSTLFFLQNSSLLQQLSLTTLFRLSSVQMEARREEVKIHLLTDAALPQASITFFAPSVSRNAICSCMYSQEKFTRSYMLICITLTIVLQQHGKPYLSVSISETRRTESLYCLQISMKFHVRSLISSCCLSHVMFRKAFGQG